MKAHSMLIIKRNDFDGLIGALQQRGYEIMGPRIRDGAIVYDEIRSAADFPEGWTDEQEKSRYRLKRRSDKALFGYAVGPHSWKKFLFPPLVKFLTVVKKGKTVEIKQEGAGESLGPFAFIGVRSCELHAIALQDKVFMNGQLSDSCYRARRKNLFIVAVNCTNSGETCFCDSMKTGPGVSGGFDILLTEVVGNGIHYFAAEAGTQSGSEVLNDVPHKNPEAVEVAAARDSSNPQGRPCAGD